jgi:Uma2 family endonuclease
MSARTPLTFEGFEQRYDEDGLKHELLEGELITVPPAKIRKAVIREKLADLLRPYIEQNSLGEVYVRAGFKLSPATWLQPDVSFIRAAQLERTDPDGYFEGSPAIAIEVASDSNTAAQLDRKIEQYFAHGAEEVWVVYPETRKIRIHFPDGTSRTAGDELQSAALPDWSAGISTIFSV